ncbi:MAG: rhomboid family intramembrane serine protease [Phycisphaerae bacterium]|nr:rhomboid family intramembrane serine protease [Phycisphaerae bacterium]
MGLSDRDYMSGKGGPRGSFTPGRVGGSGRGLSVTVWLIIVCVGVFVIDGFLPLRWDPVEVEWAQGVTFASPAEEAQVRSRLTPGPIRIQERRARPGTIGIRGLSDAAGRVVAAETLRAEPFLNSLLYFSTNRAVVHRAPDGSLRGFEFWRFLGFQFVHSGWMHLAFNMIGLWFFGPIVERTLGGKRYLAFYLLCGICGALMYLLLNAAGSLLTTAFGAQAASWAPFLLFNDPSTPLVGASAGVFGVLMAGAYLVPHATVLVWGILPMRLDTLAYALVGIALLTLVFQGSNAGGEAAHLGGAIAGFYFIRRPHHLHGFFDVLGRVDPTSRTRRARASGAPPPSRAAIAPGRSGPSGASARVDAAEIDRILRKVSEQGVHSLTPAEQETLRRASANS